MLARKKYTALQKEYAKELRRIKSGISRNISHGYVYNKIPQMPKRVTKKSLERIKQKKPLDYAIKTARIDVETGERVKAKNFKPVVPIQTKPTKEIKTSESTLKESEPYVMPYDSFSTNIIKEFKNSFAYFPAPIRNKLLAWINTLENEQGEESVVEMILNSDEHLTEYLSRVGYDSESAIAEYCSAMMEYLPDASEQYKKDLMDMFENEEIGYDIE